MKAAFYTLGCKVNQYETEVMQTAFQKAGYTVVSPHDDADVFVINSCTVTASGDQKTLRAVRKFRRENPFSVIALTGCLPQAFPERATVCEADVVTGVSGRARLVEKVQAFLKDRQQSVCISNVPDAFEPMRVEQFAHRTRAFVKISDGCNQFCSYCIIPYARGRVRSKQMEDLKLELSALSDAGYKEVVLTGINLCCYGRDIGLSLIDAVELACSFDFSRVRLGSLEPELISDEDIKRMSALPKLCPQFHLSLQSGCDETLKRMNRRYDTGEYKLLADKLRTAFPGCAITTDIMAGFPGETDDEFAKTLSFVKQSAFAKTHIFPYSRRPGTPAAGFPDQVDKNLKTLRCKQLSEATKASEIDYLSSLKGKVCSVLFETFQGGVYEGLTDTYVTVRVKSESDLRKQIRQVRIEKIDEKKGVCYGI